MRVHGDHHFAGMELLVKPLRFLARNTVAHETADEAACGRKRDHRPDDHQTNACDRRAERRDSAEDSAQRSADDAARGDTFLGLRPFEHLEVVIMDVLVHEKADVLERYVRVQEMLECVLERAARVEKPVDDLFFWM